MNTTGKFITNIAAEIEASIAVDRDEKRLQLVSDIMKAHRIPMNMVLSAAIKKYCVDIVDAVSERAFIADLAELEGQGFTDPVTELKTRMKA